MIPFFHYTTIPLGPINIQVWGLLVALGMLVGLLVARSLAVRSKLDGEVVIDLAVWTLIPALVFARLGYVLFYDWSLVWQNPWSVFKVWEGGMSSFGGYLGAALGALIFVRVNKLVDFQRYAEIFAFALPLGYGIGRLGCFLIHDHPGVLNDSFLAVAFPTGARLDHGLLLSLFGFVLFAVWLVLWRWRGWRPGETKWRYLPLLLLCYGLYRLVLDFFRAWDLPSADVRYLYLTPAQFGALLLIVLAVWFWRQPATQENET